MTWLLPHGSPPFPRGESPGRAVRGGRDQAVCHQTCRRKGAGRRGMRELFTRPWLRAPFLLWRQPGLLLALAAAAFVAVLPAASAPLFLSSARTAALHNQLDNTCAA